MEQLNTHPIKKSDLGFHGNLFGGKLLSWIDASAAGFQCNYVIHQEWLQYQ
jgi:acyl-CoA hydrolase